MSRRVLPVGERGLLVECADLGEVRALTTHLGEHPPEGVQELVPAARTLLVLVDHARRRTALADVLARLVVDAREARPAGEVLVDTVYDGADLEAVSDVTGVSVEALVRRHSQGPWEVAFLGFAPGFAYLTGGDLDVPRRAEPRSAVPAGAVAVAGPWSAVYPRRSPGGWQLLGHTSLAVWDVDRTPPALLAPGARVRFRPVRATSLTSGPTGPPARPAGPAPGTQPGTRAGAPARGALEVVGTGAQVLVEDLGRPGRLALGVPRSGAADRGAARRANRLVGNPAGAAVLEVVLGGLAVAAVGRQVLAVTGAPAPCAVVGPDGGTSDAPADAPFVLPDGHVLRLGTPATGLRTYVAVRGGLDVPATLGSRSTDVLSGLGPPAVTPGRLLPVGGAAVEAVAAWSEPGPACADEAVVRVRPGPRADWLAAGGLARLAERAWTVSDDSNRVGLRLLGEPLARSTSDELVSEGVVPGAVQVPASGLPVVFLADHPVTGGYPVVAVVVDADLDRLAQARPGSVVRFVVEGVG